MATKRKPFIYFVQGQNGGPIKIGLSVDPYRRLQNLQQGNSERLRLLLIFYGNRGVELGLHKRFSRFRVLGEWFSPVKEIKTFIKEKRNELIEL